MKKSLIILFAILILAVGCEKKEDTDNATTSSKDNTVSTPKLGENEYISVKDNKVRKYTFTYSDKATCEKMGDSDAYDIVFPVKPYVVFGCEKVKDAKGNILWGVFFYEHADDNSIFYY